MEMSQFLSMGLKFEFLERLAQTASVFYLSVLLLVMRLCNKWFEVLWIHEYIRKEL